MAELGPEVWNPEGVKVLGTLVGSTRFVEEVVNKRLEEVAPTTPCARCHRPSQRFTVAPTMLEYGLLGNIPSDREAEAQQLSTLPMRMGGLGLRSTERLAPVHFGLLGQTHLP